MALGRHGDHGNIWNEFVYKQDEDIFSDAFDTKMGNEIHAFGAANGNAGLRLQFSQDGEHWYNGPSVDVDEDGHFEFRESGIQARYVRLQGWTNDNFDGDGNDDDDRMITATMVAKTVR